MFLFNSKTELKLKPLYFNLFLFNSNSEMDKISFRKEKVKAVFVLLITASEKHKNKGITSGSSSVCINAVIASHALVFSVP